MLNRNKHRQIMFQILKDIFTSKLWRSLAFKWWTACYFLHWLDRFSTDLDFDLLAENIEIDEDIIEILQPYGTIKQWHNIILSYGEHDVNIKIDINRTIWKHNHYTIVNFYGTDIRVQDKATIFANKIVAFLERNANRDIYDIYFFFKNLFPVNKDLIQERTWKSYNEIIIDIKNKLKTLPQHYKILDWLGEVLSIKQKHFVKNNLIKELIGFIDLQIDFWDKAVKGK